MKMVMNPDNEMLSYMESSLERKRKVSEDWGRRKKEKRSKSERKFGVTESAGFKGEISSGKTRELTEMWDMIAGSDSENDKEGSIGDAPQGEELEEDSEIEQLFKGVNKKKKKTEKTPAEIAILVERLMAEFEVTAEEDAELNRQSKPAINKLKKLPLLTEVLSKKQLQQEFLDHGLLTLLKNWLEALPDGSLPNITIRSAILKILSDFPIQLDQCDRREQLKQSGLGKVIMFLSRSNEEESTSNRKLANDLVNKWSRSIFNKSTLYDEKRNYDDERTSFRRPPMKKPAARKDARMEYRDDDDHVILGQAALKQGTVSSQSSERQDAYRPEAVSLDFWVRPQSKIDPDEIRGRAKQVGQDQRRLRINKKLQKLKASKTKQLQATRRTVQGRGMAWV